MADKTTIKPEPALLGEIATTRDGRDITQPWVRGLREARDPKLSMAVDWGAYDVVFNDDQVKSTVQQRIGAVVSRDWNTLPGDDKDPRSVAAAERFDQTMKRLKWDATTGKMLMASFYGYSVAEMMWDYRDGLFDFVGVKVRHARRFRYDDQDKLRMLVPGNMQGEIMPQKKFWVHAVGAPDDDSPYGLGLAHWLYWPTLFKRNGIRFWNIFLDKFGTPTAKGTYPPSAAPEQVNKLLMALQAIATDSGFVVPEGMAVELLTAAKSGTADFHQLCAYMDSAIAKIVLSQTMTTDNGSSRAQGQVHADVKLEVIKSDADQLTDSFTEGPARWWTDFNFGPDVAAPIVRRVVEEEEDAKANAETDTSLAALGWVRTKESFDDTYGEGYVRKDDPQAPSGSMPPAPPSANFTQPEPVSFAEPLQPASAHDDIDSIVDRMIAEDGYRVANAMTGTLLDRIIGATSAGEARALLASALGTMDEKPLMQALERAGFAAQLDAAAQSAPVTTVALNG